MIKNGVYVLFVAIALQACSGKDIEIEADLDRICASQSFNSNEFKVRRIDYGIQLKQLEVQLETVMIFAFRFR